MNNQQLLSALLKTAQSGQVELRSILDLVMCPSLRNTLEKQLQEYDAVETEAFSIALQRGWELNGLDPIIRFFTDKVIRIQLNSRDTDSRIAGIMIQKNTQAMIKGIRNLHQFEGQDPQIRILSQKLLDCENANIRQLQPFL